MQDPSLNPRKTVVFLLLLFVVLPICFFVYTGRHSSYPIEKPAGGNVIVNAYVLQEWLPKDTADFVSQRIYDYLKNNGIADAQVTIEHNKVTIQDDGEFTFTIDVEPSGQESVVAAKLNNYEGTLSTSVYIDGQLQTFAPLSKSGGTDLEGFNSLINVGLSALQTNEVQNVLLGYAQDAQTISVNSDEVEHAIHRQPDGNISQEIDFPVRIDDTKYQAMVTYSSVTDIHLFLHDESGAQVLDSGEIDTSVQP